MAYPLQTLQAQPGIPYNVLANPLLNNADTQPGSLADLIESLKEAWVEFQKTGSDKLLLTTLQNGYSAASGGSFNYLAVLQAGIGILGTVLGAEIPGVAVAAPILSMVVGWLWPNKSQNDTQKLINLIDQEIQQQLNQALSDQDKNNWTGYLDAIFDISSDASRSVVDAQFTGTEGDDNRNPRTPGVSDYENVYNHLLAGQSSLILALSQMINGNFDTLAIPFFVIGASVQLSAYQSFIEFGNKWISIVYPDYQTQGTAGYTQYQNLNNAKTDMRKAIHTNTQKVFNAFKNGMPSLGSDKNAINTYNIYTRGMILNGLDMVATWPAMYPDDYPSQMNLEHTRVIFSDMVGQDQSKNGSTTIYNILDKTGANAWNQHAPISPDSLFYYPDDFTTIDVAQHYSTSPNIHCYPYGLILNYPSGTYVYGQSYNPWGETNMKTVTPPVISVNASTQYNSTTSIVYESLDFKGINGQTGGLAGCYPTGYCTNTSDCYAQSGCSEGYGYSCTPNFPTQKMNVAFPFVQSNTAGQKDRQGVLASFVPSDLSPSNVFGAIDNDTQNIIGKGFPAEKGFVSAGGRPKVVREWVNGANAVNLTPGNTLTISATNLTGGQYHVRVRYANAGTTTASLTQSVVANGSQIQGGGWGFKSTTDANIQANFPNQVYVTGQQGNYVIQDISWPTGGGPGDPLTLPSGNVVVSLTLQPQETNTQVFIDRIELIPVIQITHPSDNTINYTITSTLWEYWNESGSGPDDFPTIWTASSGENGVSADINATNLDNNVTFIAMNGDDWSSAVPMHDATGNYSISNGDFTLRPYGDQPFTVIKIGSYSPSYVTRGTITGTVNTPQN
ncbi:delta endotoxin C-terminal domain-containing protein [Bacillus cereus]|uniref:delta endotoxin C-terminal domain-containing protein n=1 Tax=Bacillus cereus TaxID=1396 RepID=UPI0009C445ED|nr:delta endotoxin C-terminal domain-containing protein [Bacillus cereus]OPA06342.1 hypothetical protein BHL54_26830 [Bacillus cereus]